MENVVELLKGARQTNVTKTTRSKLYPTVSPTRPELSQKGKVVLVTGGGSNIGLSLSHAFVQASSDTIIIVGRRTAVLEGARKELEDEAHAAGTGTKIIARSADLTNLVDIAALWKELGNKGLTVDVYVANAATITGPAPLFEVGADGVWAGIEGNLKSQLYMTEKFMAQGGDKKKFIVNVSSAAIHGLTNPIVIQRPVYTMGKLFGTALFQFVSQDYSIDKLQVVSFHPGCIHNEEWQGMGFGPEEHFDDKALAGGFAVWAASEEAAFLNGRYGWASWDVEELASGEIRKRINEDPYFFKVSVNGLREGMKV